MSEHKLSHEVDRRRSLLRIKVEMKQSSDYSLVCILLLLYWDLLSEKHMTAHLETNSIKIALTARGNSTIQQVQLLAKTRYSTVI